jgi:hypothetical protein
MKNIFRLSCLACLLVSCVSSLYPITENSKDIIFKNELIGTWKDVNGSAVYVVNTFNSEDGKKYKVMVLDNGNDKQVVDTSNFLVMLVNIKGHYFFDCMPDTTLSTYAKMSDLIREVTIPCHYIIKIYSIDSKYIGLSAIDKDALVFLFKSKKIAIKHEVFTKDNILLTEKPDMLKQKLIDLENSSVYKRDSLVKVK